MSIVFEIGALVGRDRVRPPQGLELRAAGVIVEPQSAEEVSAIIERCEAGGITLAAIGAARTLAPLRRVPVALGVSLRRLNRIVAYEPDDMTVVVEAGLTLGDLNRELALRGQRLAIDPPVPGVTTIGASIAAAKAGPLRLSEGTVRDLLIGIRFVVGRGRSVHGGGRVVKNVAGYDLMKVMTGSFGTLGIITEATFKVGPIPDRYTIAVASFARADDAFGAARNVYEAAPLIHLEVASPAVSLSLGRRGGFTVIAGFGGSAAETAYLGDKFVQAIGAGGELLAGTAAGDAYQRLRDVEFADAPLVGQIAVLPAELPRCLEQCAAEFRAHAGSGVAQLGIAAAADGNALTPAAATKIVARWRAVANQARGHLRVLKAAVVLPAEVDFFDRPQQGALGLMRRLKESFDPASVFNPGAFVGGL